MGGGEGGFNRGAEREALTWGLREALHRGVDIEIHRVMKRDKFVRI